MRPIPFTPEVEGAPGEIERSRLRGVLRAAAFLSLIGVLFPFQCLAAPLGHRARSLVRRIWARGTCRILGIRVRRTGEPFRGCPTLVVANHVSYVDIPCLATLLDGTFIAKSEVAGWPLFGHLARLGGTMFVRRHWRQALIQRNELASRMARGEGFILFAEGTSTNGMAVLPLKTSLLSVAEPWVLDMPVAVQPVTIAYLRFRDGRPIDASTSDHYAWWGDRPLMPHLWPLLQLPGVEVEIRLGKPVISSAVSSRKRLGREMRLELWTQLNAARNLPPPELEPRPAILEPDLREVA